MNLWDFFEGGIDTLLQLAADGFSVKCQWDREVDPNCPTFCWGVTEMREAG